MLVNNNVIIETAPVTGQEYIEDISCNAAQEVIEGNPAKLFPVTMVTGSARHIYVGMNPDANWDTYTSGEWTAYITYTSYRSLQ